MLTYGAAAMSLGFFYRTGGEVNWKSSMAFASDPKGMKVLMSEAQSTVVPAIALLLVSWLARPLVFLVSTALVASLSGPLSRGKLTSPLGLSTKSDKIQCVGMSGST